MATNNTITLIGNLGQNPETYTNDKGEYIVFSLATNDSYFDEICRQWKTIATTWYRVLAFHPTAKQYAQTFAKGDRVKIIGIPSSKAFVTKAESNPRNCDNTIIARCIFEAPLPKKRRKSSRQNSTMPWSISQEWGKIIAQTQSKATN